ncbi:Maf family protein [Aquibacillus albus]|uniref:dTTP/UTP pyrophosphatase n=1 Tax=Aquibacillus albus TaxID=1168171 RepID=A0ABS2N1Q6_9BACI|nr:Maf family protein [Aquibacillus albus]MBM7572026.1 septum formation protein [Aquibacillus albus]
MAELVLASGSPRRRDLLEQVGFSFVVRSTNIDESFVTADDPKALVESLAQRKGQAISLKEKQVVLSADTVVCYEGNVLTKPDNDDQALQMLNMLNGKEHQVYTGVMIRSLSEEVIFSTVTNVEFWNVPEQVLLQYMNTGEPFDKAGGYGIQSVGAFLVKQIRGDYFNVVGLPISRVVQELIRFHIYPSFFK